MNLEVGWFTIGFTFLFNLFNKIWEPVALHFGYPINLDERVGDLLKAAERLRDVQCDLRALDPFPFTQKGKAWHREVQQLRTLAQDLKMQSQRCSKRHYFRLCKIGKQADTGLKNATILLADGEKMMDAARFRPHQARRLEHLQSDPRWMKPYKDKVMEFVKCKRNDRVPLLGIWGMGGIGKTTLLEMVRDSHVVRDHFDHVLFVRAGMGCTAAQLRNSIASVMGLTPPVQESAEYGAISNHLLDNSYLLLIDDLWDSIILEKAGIPVKLGSVGLRTRDGYPRQVHRKVVFTTRNLAVCGRMGCIDTANIIHLRCLSHDDSWSLFTENVGYKIADDSPIHPFAKKIVDECNGLPKALCTLGRAMSAKRDSRQWMSAVDLLMESKLDELNDGDEELFKCLKLSFDVLPDIWKDCFLLCSLWFRDENIPREKLVEWWIGAGLMDVRNPRQMGHTLILTFLWSSLLEVGDASISTGETSHVKMHRMIRRMALWVVNDSGKCDKLLPHSPTRPEMPSEKWRMVQKAWVSKGDARRFSSSFHCPHLTWLVTRDSFSLRCVISFKEISFLDLEGTRRDVFPVEICALAKLMYLNISGTKIDELPMELCRLSNLKYLYMRDCAYLQTIARGLISRLEKLLVLELFCPSGTRKIQYFASLMQELQSKKLDMTMFSINLQNNTDVTKLIQSDRVRTLGVCLDNFEDESNPTTVDLSLVSPLNSLLELTVVKCSRCTELVAEGNLSSGDCRLFPLLEVLELSCLPRLQKVRWINAGINIRVVVFYKCCKLRHATWVQNLPNLTELKITYCPEMEQLIDSAEVNVVANPIAVGFCSLKRLYLEQLPHLSSVCEHGFPFEELSYVFVDGCQNLKAIKVERRVNQHKITIDCNTSWWTGLGHHQAIMTPHFIRRFSF